MEDHTATGGFLTIEEVADLLDKVPATVRALARRGEGPQVYRLGRRLVRFKRSEVLEWIEAGRQRDREIARVLREGVPRAEVARRFSLTPYRVGVIVANLESASNGGNKRSRPGPSQRNAEIARLRQAGHTVTEVSERFPISKQRVGQITKQMGVNGQLEEQRQQQKAQKERQQEERADAEREARLSQCRVCQRPFYRGHYQTVCSSTCAEIVRIGRRYLNPERYDRERLANATFVLAHPERHDSYEVTWARRVLDGSLPSGRRWVRPDSRIVELLRQVGREDLLPPRKEQETQRRSYPCVATNQHGNPFRHRVRVEGAECHIHQASSNRGAS
jgi:excisionase family DNA binding protein